MQLLAFNEMSRLSCSDMQFSTYYYKPVMLAYNSD